jgi:hypothetical protein
MPHLHLLTDAEREIVQNAEQGSLLERLLCSVVLSLAENVKRLERKVSDIEGRERV